MGKIVSGIFKTISSVISGIVKTIKSVVNAIFKTISSVLSGLFKFLFSSQLGMVLGIAMFFLPQNALWSIGKFLFRIERFLPLPLETRLALQLKTLSFFGKLQGWQSAIWFKVGAITHTIYKVYKLQEIKLKLYLWDLSERINEALGFNLGQLIGSIYNKLSEAGKFLNKLVTLGYIYDSIKKRNYFRAFYYTVDYFDSKIKAEIDHIIIYVKSLVDGAYRELSRINNFINSILSEIQIKAGTFENAFIKLADLTGVEVFEDIADGLHRLIIDNVTELRYDIYQATLKLRSFMTSANARVYQLWRMIYEWDNIKREMQGWLRVFEFNPFIKTYNLTPLYIYIPKPLRGAI